MDSKKSQFRAVQFPKPWLVFLVLVFHYGYSVQAWDSQAMILPQPKTPADTSLSLAKPAAIWLSALFEFKNNPCTLVNFCDFDMFQDICLNILGVPEQFAEYQHPLWSTNLSHSIKRQDSFSSPKLCYICDPTYFRVIIPIPVHLSCSIFLTRTAKWHSMEGLPDWSHGWAPFCRRTTW